MSNNLYGELIELTPDGHPIVPDLILSFRNGTKQGVISNVQSLVNTNALADIAEISFDVYKTANNVECELWNEIKDFRLVYIPHLDKSNFNPWYEISVEIDEDDCTIKHCSGTHLQETELGQLSLNNIEINTENDISREDYIPTTIHNKNPRASALSRILKDKAAHYKIVHVDSSIATLQRTFSMDGIDIKSAFDEIAEEVECLFKYGESTVNDGKIHRTISVYDLNDNCMDCGERGSFSSGVCPKCKSKNVKFGYGTDSGIFLSHENFAEEINYSSNKDSVKNCFRLVAGDELMTATVRNINPSGSQYIWHLSEELRADMSPQLRSKLSEYDKEYSSYISDKVIELPNTVISEYNALIDKYKTPENKLTNAEYPIVGYTALTDLYYAGLNFYSYLKTTLAPATVIGTHTTAEKEIAKLTEATLSPIGVQNAGKASATTITSAIQNYAKVFIDTSLYRITAKNISYSAQVWKGTLTLTGYANDTDKATTPELTIHVSDAKPDFIKCQLEKAMKKNDVDATGTIALFKKNDVEFRRDLASYSADNLNILANISRGCLDILIQQGVADPTNPLYTSLYLPYFNKNTWIQEELRERERELLKLRGTKVLPTGLLDYIESRRKQISQTLDLYTYLGEVLWAEFCSFRRDDTYQNENFISDGLSDSDLILQAKEFLKRAEREIVKSATLQHSISCNLGNLLLVRERDASSLPPSTATIDGIKIATNNENFLVKSRDVLSPLLFNFDVGNWVHIEIDNKIYKLRLTSYKIDYDNLDSLDVEFSDVTYGLGSFSDVQSILSQAQSMATSYSTVQRQANKGDLANRQIIDMVENGLNLTNKKIVNAATNQNMVVDETGLLMREKNEFGDDYSSEQTKIINHGFYYTKDNWKTVQTGLGKYVYYDPETGTYKEDYGIIAQKIVGNIILGNEVGIYNPAGSVKIDSNGFTITADPKDTNKDLFTVQKKNEDGSFTKYIYVDDSGNIRLNGNCIQMSAGGGLDSFIDTSIKNQASALVMHLSNEYIGISTDSNGDGGDFSNCFTDVVVFIGSEHITDSVDLSWNVTSTNGVEGSWDAIRHRYTVANLTSDSGEVTFSLTYKNNLSVSKKFKISKVKSGKPGASGAQGASIVATVSRDNFSEDRWNNNYGKVGQTNVWSETASNRNGCRIGDLFTVTGVATDTKNMHIAFYKSNTASGDLSGECVSHSFVQRGLPGEDAAIASKEPPTDTSKVWLDIRYTPSVFRRYNGKEWEVINEAVVDNRNIILNSTNLVIDNLSATPGSKKEFAFFDLGKSYMDIPSGTVVTISFDLTLKVNRANPFLLVYNGNYTGPKTFTAHKFFFTAAVGETITKRCSFTTKIVDSTTIEKATNHIEFYTDYGSSNWFKISKLKMEIGRTASPWAPALEDLVVDEVFKEIGGKNLILESNKDVPPKKDQPLTSYKTSAKLIKDEQYVVTIWGELAPSKTSWRVYVDNYNITPSAWPTKIGNGVYQAVFVHGDRKVAEEKDFHDVYVFTNPTTSTEPSTIKLIKLEKGNKGTEWSPAPEDTINQLATQLQDSIVDNNASISALSKEIRSEVSSTYYSKNDGKLLEQMQSELMQTAEGFKGSVSALTQTVDKNNANAVEEFKEIKRWFEFDKDFLTIGSSDSKTKLNLKNDVISFIEDGSVISRWGKRSFSADNAIFDVTCQIGQFAFTPRDNGSLSFGKVGN